MPTADQRTRPDVIGQLKQFHKALTVSLDAQARAVIGRDYVGIVDVTADERGHTLLVGQYSTGETRVFSRKDYLPNGDDGSSLVYQARVLEQLAREHSAVAAALHELEQTERVLATPPEPRD